MDYNIQQAGSNFKVEGDWPGEVMGKQKDGSDKEYHLYQPHDVFRVNEDGWFYWPEYQLRIYRNLDHIRYMGEIHESLEGLNTVMTIEPSKTYAIIHEKTIAKQLKSDKYYENFEHHRRLHSENIHQRKTIVEARKKIMDEVEEVNRKYSNDTENI